MLFIRTILSFSFCFKWWTRRSCMLLWLDEIVLHTSREKKKRPRNHRTSSNSIFPGVTILLYLLMTTYNKLKSDEEEQWENSIQCEPYPNRFRGHLEVWAKRSDADCPTSCSIVPADQLCVWESSPRWAESMRLLSGENCVVVFTFDNRSGSSTCLGIIFERRCNE